jgi:hypothetical protein
MDYLSNNEQASSFITHDTTRDIGPYGNEGSLNGNGNISRLNVYNMKTGGKRTRKTRHMSGGGFGFGENLELIGHGHHAAVNKTMACEQHPKHYDTPSWSEMSGGSPAAANDSYVLVDHSTINYPMEGVASENGVPFHGFNGGKDLSDFAGSYAPIEVGVHNGGGGPRFLSLWKRVCPGAVVIYNAELKQNMSNPKVKAIIKHYSNVFRTEEEALKCKQAFKVKRMMSSMRTALSNARKCLASLKSKMLGTHAMISKMHLGRVGKHLASLKQTKKNRKTMRHRKTMRGGYHQYGSNVVQSSGYSPVLDTEASTPHHVERHAGNAIDNYNHFTGKGAEPPILDSDVVAPVIEDAPNGSSWF